MYPNNMFFQDDEELAKMLQEGLAKSENVADIEQVPQEFATTIRTDKDRYKLLAKQLGMLSNPASVRDYSDKISELANQASDNRITQQQMQDVADKQAAIGFLTNPGRSMFYGNGQATDVTPYSIEGNRQFGEDLKKRANVPIDYADRARRYNSEDLKKLEGVQQLELNELDKKTKAANSVVGREAALQGLKTKMEMDDPNSQISKDAVKSFAQQMDVQIAENMGDSRKRYRDLSKSMAAAKLSAVGSSYNQIQNMMSNDKDMFGRAKDKVDQDIKERYGEQMAAAAGIRAQAAATTAATPKHEEMVLIKDMDRLKSAIDAMGEIGRIKSNVNTGIFEGPVKSALSKLGVEYNDMRELKAGVSRQFNKETKEIAGSAVTANEWQRIEPSIPSINDDDDVFVTKLRKAIIETQRMLDDRVSEFEVYKTGKLDLNKYKSRLTADPAKIASPDKGNPKVSDPGYMGDVITQNNITYKWSVLDKKYKPLKVN